MSVKIMGHSIRFPYLCWSEVNLKINRGQQEGARVSEYTSRHRVRPTERRKDRRVAGPTQKQIGMAFRHILVNQLLGEHGWININDTDESYTHSARRISVWSQIRTITGMIIAKSHVTKDFYLSSYHSHTYTHIHVQGVLIHGER